MLENRPLKKNHQPSSLGVEANIKHLIARNKIIILTWVKRGGIQISKAIKPCFKFDAIESMIIELKIDIFPFTDMTIKSQSSIETNGIPKQVSQRDD